MAVYRLPPVAQWYQPHLFLDLRSVDTPDPQPLPKVVHLRRRHDYESEQQPRHLLDVSIITTVDSPIPLPPPPIVNLRDRHEYETLQQPRRLLDLAVVQSVDSPIPLPTPPIVNLRRRADYEVGQQSPRRLVDVTIAQSVDSPPGYPAAQLYERIARFVGEQFRGLPVDILAPAVVADNPTGAPYNLILPALYTREQWLQGRALDVSITQSTDSPPGFWRNQPWPPVPTRVQWQQAPLPYQDVPVTYIPFTIQAFTQPPKVDRAPWLQAKPLDTSVTQSVDSPPGYFRFRPPDRTDPRVQWKQATPAPIIGPDVVNPTFNPWVYFREAARTQAWQKTQPVFHLVTVDSPPLSGPYPTAPYRRPRYSPPVPQTYVAGLIAPPFIPSGPFANLIRTHRPGVIELERPPVVRTADPERLEVSRPRVYRTKRPGSPE